MRRATAGAERAKGLGAGAKPSGALDAMKTIVAKKIAKSKKPTKPTKKLSVAALVGATGVQRPT